MHSLQPMDLLYIRLQFKLMLLGRQTRSLSFGDRTQNWGLSQSVADGQGPVMLRRLQTCRQAGQEQPNCRRAKRTWRRRLRLGYSSVPRTAFWIRC